MKMTQNKSKQKKTLNVGLSSSYWDVWFFAYIPILLTNITVYDTSRLWETYKLGNKKKNG